MTLSLKTLTLLSGVTAAFAVVSMAGAQPAQVGSTTTPARVMQVPLGGTATQVPLLAGTSRDITLDVDVRNVSFTKAGVVDIIPVSTRQYQLLGIGSGRTDVAFYDQLGRRVLTLDVQVEQNLSGLAETIARVAPNARVEAIAQNNFIILTGQVANAAESGRVAQVAAGFVADPKNVLNLLTISGRDQVMLKVRIVEMQRNLVKQLGFDINAVIGRIGESQTILGNAATFAVNGGFQGSGRLGATLVDDDNTGDAMLKAFERVGMVRILSEPNVTAVSGEAARFEAGGEFPVPTGQDNNGRVTIEFKKFGVALGVTPVVLSEGRIALKLSTEVSELTSQGAFTLSTGSGSAGLTIPGLNMRRADTSVELPSGGSMMIAGLIREQTRQNIDGLPGAGRLGPLGAPFRSRDYQSNETELVIIVTAILVAPTDAGRLQTPADRLVIANDAQTILMGRLNSAYKVSPEAVARRTYEGPYGHVID